MKKENKSTGPITSGINRYLNEAFHLFTRQVNIYLVYRLAKAVKHAM